MHRKAPVRLVRRARALLVRGISLAATALRIGRRPPAPPRIRPPRKPRVKSPPDRTGRAKSPPESSERPTLRALLVLGLVRSGARSHLGQQTVRRLLSAGDRADPRILRRPSRSISRGSQSSRNTSRGHRPRRNRGRSRRRLRRLSRSKCLRSRLSRRRCPRSRLSRSKCLRRRPSRSKCPRSRLSRSRCLRRRPSRSKCPRSRLSHDRSRRPEAKLRALPLQRSLILHLRRRRGLPVHSRALGPYPYGIRRRRQHPSNPSWPVWGSAERPSRLRQTRLLRQPSSSLSNSNPRGPSRSRRQPHPVGRPRRLLRQVQSLRPDRRLVRQFSSARRP